MALRQISEKMTSGELLAIYLDGTDPEDKVVVAGDLSVIIPDDAPSDGEPYGRKDAVWERTQVTHPKWKNTWVPGPYLLNDMVRDGDLTMIANKDTSDRPAPQPVGNAAYLLPENPPWVPATHTGAVWQGIRIHNPPDPILVRALRVWIPSVDANVSYQVVIENNLTGDHILGRKFFGDVVGVVGWYEFYIDPIWVSPDLDMSFLVVATNHINIASFNYPWNWLEPNDTEATPNNGNCRADKTYTTFRISHTDANAANRTAEITQAREIGTKITIVEDGDTTKYITFEVLGWVDYGTYTSFATKTLGIGPGGVPTVSIKCDLYFDIPVFLPIDFGDIYDYFVDASFLHGVLGFDNATLIESNYAYGLDLLAHRFIASPDWDLVSISLGSGVDEPSEPGGLYVFSKAANLLDIPADPIWTPVVSATGPTINGRVYELKFSLTGQMADTNDSMRIRYRLNGGAWFTFSNEASDNADTWSISYFFPRVSDGSDILLEIEAQKESGGAQFDIYFADAIIDQKS